MKELINYIADPIRSFPIVTVLFWLLVKKYRTVGTKRFAWISLLLVSPVVIWAALDPNFWLIITWPDNIPISILIIALSFFTWYTLYRAAINDARHDEGLGPIEGEPENREKVWCWL